LSKLNLIRAAAVLLLLLAGYLWSARLSQEIFASGLEMRAQADSKSLTHFREQIEQKDDAITLVVMGKNFLSSDSTPYAIIALERATEVNPNYRDAWYLLGYAYVQSLALPEVDRMSHAEKAKIALETARTIDPTHQPTIDLLEQLK
jgi:Flp pilus assembly protein TadD